MNNVKQLIETNNHRRTELTPENEKYYSDLLLYIRLKLFLSEQQSEEVLMEILDHLIEGQTEGKSAQEIFGADPKEYADEIVCQLPNENKLKLGKFILEIVLNFLGFFLIARGVVLLIASFFKEVDIAVYPFKSIVMFILILSFIVFEVWLIFGIIGGSIYNRKRSLVMESILVGISAMIIMGILILVGYFLPDFGLSFSFTWYASEILGLIIYGGARYLKNTR